MPDTIRTLADLQSRLVLAPAGISGQDLRDMLVSLASIYQQHGTKGWRDLTAPFLSAKTTPSTAPTWEAWLGGIFGYSFSATVQNELVLPPFHIDHDYADGTAIYPHVHWAPSSTAAGVVRWGVEYTWARGHSQGAFGAPATLYIEQAASGVTNQHQIAELAAPGISLAGLEPDSLLIVRVFRDGAHANDTYGAKAWGFMLDFHYQADRNSTKNKVPDFNA